MRVQRVAHLLVLDRELALVGQHLPRRAGMVGERRDALGARLEHLERARLGVAALALRDDRAHEVAGDGARDEDDVALEAGDAVAAVGEGLDAQVELRALLGAREGGGFHECAAQDRWRLPAGGRAEATCSCFSIAASTDLRFALRRSWSRTLRSSGVVEARAGAP